MDYFVVIEGQKKGPFDIIMLIKKIKTGVITEETLVAPANGGDFLPANEIGEIRTLLEEHSGGGAQANELDHKPDLRLAKYFKAGVDLWANHVVSFTIFSGAILFAGFLILTSLKKISFIGDYPFIANYFSSFVSVILYCVFFYFILFAKRSQAAEVHSLLNGIKNRIGSIAVLAAVFSCYTLAYELGQLVGIVFLTALMFVVSIFTFTPFLVFDNNLGLGTALKSSAGRVTKLGADNFGVILFFVAINLLAAVVPVFIVPDLFVFGLIVSIPITVSSLAFIYDELFS